MNIMLGNLNVDQIEKRLGINFPADVKKFMEITHQLNADNVLKGKWHCFDIPFNIVFGDIETATKVFNSVKDKSNECKEQLQFSIQK